MSNKVRRELSFKAGSRYFNIGGRDHRVGPKNLLLEGGYQGHNCSDNHGSPTPSFVTEELAHY